MEEPYSRIKDLPLLNNIIQENHNNIMNAHKKPILNKINNIVDTLNTEMEKLPNEFTQEILSIFERIKEKLDKANYCTELDAHQVRLENEKTATIRKIDEKRKEIQGGKDTKKTVYVQISEISNWNTEIKTPEDLAKYIEHLKNVLRKILDQDQNIKII